eukprot:NODE_192_length_15450_cov_0.476355.p4 type:complete len:246 gc:universal NODE_192_length_15450_cov_0.476355:270-1007(+)
MSNYELALWGSPNALVNWCEPDYVHFNFIAETWNTLSNLVTIVLGMILFAHYKKYACEKRFLCSTLLMILVGCGSFSFHGTLLYHFQLMDELPMLYLTCCLSYVVVEMPHKQRQYPNLPKIAVATCIFLTIGHITLKNNEIFFGAFGILLAPAIAYPLTHISVTPFIYCMRNAALSLMLGFAAWEVDRFLCDLVQPLYLHAWWHVFTAMSGVFWLNAMVFIRKRYVLKEPSRLLYYGLWVELDSK